MSDGGDIDMSVTAMDATPEPLSSDDAGPRDPWEVRRDFAFGASEMAALFIALGMRHAEDFPGFIRSEAHVMKRGPHKVSRLFLRKAGLARPLKPTRPMILGSEREPELIRQWTERVRRGLCGKEARTLDPSTVQHSSCVPRSFYPLTHHRLKHLAVTPDAWALDLMGGLVAIEAKCSYQPYMNKYRDAAPHHVLQLHAQMMVMEGDAGIAVEGERWSNDYWDHAGEPSGPVRTWPVRRDESVVREIEKAIPLGWEAVQELLHAARKEAA